MTHPYATIEYGDTLRHLGEAIFIPEWGTSVVRRQIGAEYHDAIGAYPITVFKPEPDLSGGLERLARLGCVSVVLVLDDCWRPGLAELQASFDFVRTFKLHYLHDRTRSPFRFSKNHGVKIRRAMRAVSVERFDLAARLDEWSEIYEGLVTRLGLSNTMHAFPRDHYKALAQLSGTVAVGAFAGGRLLSCHVWVCYDGHAMSHLVASNEEGYAMRAAYAVNAASIDLLSEYQILNFGGGAGTVKDQSSGLERFKRGFANATASSYLCGKVLAADAYAELCRRAGITQETSYFPAYRQPPQILSDQSAAALGE
jgi:hypothetical protein